MPAQVEAAYALQSRNPFIYASYSWSWPPSVSREAHQVRYEAKRV